MLRQSLGERDELACQPDTPASAHLTAHRLTLLVGEPHCVAGKGVLACVDGSEAVEERQCNGTLALLLLPAPLPDRLRVAVHT